MIQKVVIDNDANKIFREELRKTAGKSSFHNSTHIYFYNNERKQALVLSDDVALDERNLTIPAFSLPVGDYNVRVFVNVSAGGIN